MGTFSRCKLVEGPNNILPLSADFKFRIYYVKLTSNFEKIELLDDSSDQGSSPKEVISELDLSNGLGLNTKRGVQIWLLLDFKVGL
jgi:hypothetical protein